METVLRVKGIKKAFPGVQALTDIDMEVRSGEVLAVVGENGAGKSTLMKILSGAYRKDHGQIFLAGHEVEIGSPAAAQRLGIATIYQEFNLTPNQSVAANIFIAREPLRQGVGHFFGLVDRPRMEREAARLLARVDARISPQDLVGELSVAQRQMVEIVKALSVDARIIIMDEPTASLGEQEVQTLFDTVRSLKQQGIAVIFITHRLEEIFTIADRIVVLRDGQFVGEASVADVNVDEVVRMMVGRSLKDFLHKEAAQITTPVLEVRGLRRRGAVRDVSFVLHRGEILGVTGLVGAGRTETARIIFGADPRDGGEILIDGRPARWSSPKQAVAQGVSLLPEDRGRQGLVLRLPVANNIVMASLARHSRGGWLNRPAIDATVAHFIEQLSIRTPHAGQKAMYLSGGNQQKVVLAKWLASNPKVLILDEPTRGIDVGSKAEVHALMSKLARSGIGIIMISSELPEILGMCDRIVVMRAGAVAAILDRAGATQELIMSYASGALTGTTQRGEHET